MHMPDSNEARPVPPCDFASAGDGTKRRGPPPLSGGAKSNPMGYSFRSWVRRNRWALLLVAAIFAAYQPAWDGGPVFDDADHLTPPELGSLAGLGRIWTELGAVSQYYPVTHTAFWLQHKLWGDATLGYHLVNLLLHAAAALLLGRILMVLAVPGGWLAAAIFALHPVHVESVAWISELKNTLSGVCYLGAALAYLNFDATRRRRFYAVALGLFGMGLLAKAVIASLPAALLVVFWWKRGTLSWKRDVVPLLPFFAVGVVAGLFVAWVERRFIGAEGEAFAFTFVERSLIAGRAIWFYLGKLVWPADLIFIYPRWTVSAAVAWQYLFPVAVLAFAAAAWAWRRRSRAPLAALLFFVGTLFPVLGFLNVYPFIYSFVADHYQYLASIGVMVLVAAAIARGMERMGGWGRRAGIIAGVALLGTLAVASWRHSRRFADAKTLWRTTLERHAECWVAHTNLANLLLERGEVDQAMVHGRRALKLQPGSAEIHNNLGNVLLRSGNVDEAVAHYRRALELRPGLATAHFNLGVIFLRQRRLDEARTAFEAAVALRPDYVKARVNLASLLLERGEVTDAALHLRSALGVHPDDPEAHINLGNALLRQGEPEPAIAHYERALATVPDSALAHYNLGYALLQVERVDEAGAHLEQALALEPGLAPAHYFLGGARLRRGDLDAAIRHFEAAVEANPNFVEARGDLGTALLQRGAAPAAVAQYRAALAVQPDNAGILSNLAWVLATAAEPAVRDAAQAIELADRANALTGGGNAVVLQGLAAAYAEGGRFDAAVATAADALERARNDQNLPLVEGLRAQLAQYRAGAPWRDAVTAGAEL